MNHPVEHSREAESAPAPPIAESTGNPQGFEGYDAARTGAVVYRRGARGILAIAGADASSFLHGILTNDVGSLSPGQSCYAAYLTPQGRMLADMDVLRRRDDLWLDVEESVREKLLTRFDQSIFTEDVTVTDLSAALTSFAICGPVAGGQLADVLREEGATMDPPAIGAHVAAPYGGGEITVLATEQGGIAGFHVFADRAVSDRLIEALMARGIQQLGPLAAESLRIEAGRPRYGVDMSEDTIPLEAGIEGRAISMTKGCYVGQEVIVRILHRGQGRVVRRLMGLKISGDVVPTAGARLKHGDKDAGHITSAIKSPRFGMIALGYVHRDFLEPGTRLSIQHSDGSEASVVSLPFV